VLLLVLEGGRDEAERGAIERMRKGGLLLLLPWRRKAGGRRYRDRGGSNGCGRGRGGGDGRGNMGRRGRGRSLGGRKGGGWRSLGGRRGGGLRGSHSTSKGGFFAGGASGRSESRST